MHSLYPLKFTPLLKEKIWGGDKAQTYLGFSLNGMKNCGEIWLLSDVDKNQSVVANGFLAENTLNELLEIFMGDLVGEQVFEKYEMTFPLLYKIIDASDDLSLQVHPDEEFSKKLNIGYGKTEMWYVLDAEREARLSCGFQKKTAREEVEKSVKDNTIADLLKYHSVKQGDAFYVPAGRVHAIGKGILLAEIQQSSDTTYRLSDWGRVDEKGKSRELHLQQALEVLNYEDIQDARVKYALTENKTNKMVDSLYFHTNILKLNKAMSKNFQDFDTFITYLCVEGAGRIKAGNHVEHIKKGELVFIPAMLKDIELFPESQVTLLETYILSV